MPSCAVHSSASSPTGSRWLVASVAPNHTGEVNAIFDRELDLAYLGEKSVKDAADTMKKEIDVVLKKPL